MYPKVTIDFYAQRYSKLVLDYYTNSHWKLQQFYCW